MATEIRFRRGTSLQHASFTGALAEVTVDTDKKTVVVHDGSTVGGFALITADDVSGKMSTSIYDPQEIEGDAFDRANHTGAQAISTVTGLQAALDAKAGDAATTAALALKADAATVTAALALKNDTLQPYIDIASAGTTDIGGVASTNVRVTGTNGVTSFGTAASGTFRRLRFAGVLTITHNGTSLILPGAANITTAAGDILELTSDGSGNWRFVDYVRADGRPLTYAYGLKNDSGAIAISLSASGSWTHGLGGVPDAHFVDFLCLTAEGGYGIGEYMPYHVHGGYDGATNRGVALAKTATVIKYKFSSNAIQGLRLDTGANFTITPANWSMIIRAAR